MAQERMEDVAHNRLSLITKGVIAILVLLVIALSIALAVVLGNKCTTSYCNCVFSFGTRCSSSSLYKQDTRLPKEPTIFQDLTSDELHAVRDYMIQKSGLNIVSNAKAKENTNNIYLIELFVPKKSEALAYLDAKSKKPIRKARVIVSNGAKNPPNVEQYLVEPLPNPTKHSLLLMPGYQNPIPFASRPYTLREDSAVGEVARNVSRDAYLILKESFDFWYHNCTTNCLVFVADGIAATDKSGDRQTWVIFLRNRRGYNILPIPFAFLIDHASSDTGKWKVIQVFYKNQLFPSITDLVTKYNNNQLNKTKLFITDDVLEAATFDRRGQSFLKKPTRGPVLVDPQGHRFDIDGRMVKYMAWQFHFGIRSSSGPALYDIRFNNSRILYELSMQEAVSFYSAHDPRQSTAQYLDSFFKIGSSNFELLAGVDCPENAVYVDTSHFVDTGVTEKRKNSACIFEINNGVPLRRHVEFDLNNGKFSFVAGMADQALVLRMILTPFNYDYITDFIFYQTGAIEVRLSTSGYILATSYYPEESKYAFENLPHITGTLHDHMIFYKADLDVAGQQNSYQTLDVAVENVTCPWNRLGYLTKKSIQRNTKKTEKEALLNYNFDLPKYLVFHNENAKNKFNIPRGYRIQNNHMVKQKYPDDYYVTKSSPWSKYQLVVTKHKDNERYGSSIFNQHGMANPVFNFEQYINDNDDIVNEDLVAWVTIGGLHIPSAEDIPVTVTSGNRWSFFIRPFNYFDEDPSMSSTDAVQIVQNSKGERKVETYGTPKGQSCPLLDRNFTYGSV
eukprot:gene8996-9957_t